jgi:hypothetical protein
MTPFLRAPDPDEVEVRLRMARAGRTEVEVKNYLKGLQEGFMGTFINSHYQVMKRKMYHPVFQTEMIHLSIKRLDRQPIHDWRDLQWIKNMLVGLQCEGLELYPAEDRVADSANQYHLWVFADPAFRIPVGFDSGRFVVEPEEAAKAGAIQRPFP